MRDAIPSCLVFSLAAFAVFACAEPPERSPTPVAEQVRPQLSGGPGVSVYDFVVEGSRVGSVLVTDGAWGGAYANQYEFWLWDPAATDAIRDGEYDSFSIKVVVRSEQWDPIVADAFETGTAGWTAFSIPREFELQEQPRIAYSNDSQERYVYRMVAPAWGGMQGDIRYYLELDFHPGSDVPSMEWLVDADDLKTYYASEEGDEDDDSDEDGDEGSDEGGGWGGWTAPEQALADATRWEVRLEASTSLEQVSWAWAYELTTLYPPQ